MAPAAQLRLETNRLILRRPRPLDVDDYLAFCNSVFVLQYNAMSTLDREGALAQFAREDSPWGMFALEHKDTGRMIGMIFTQEDSLRYGVRSAEFSYFLNEAYAKQGYMKEALGAVIHHLFQTEDLESVAARSFAPNTSSRRLLLSLGFHQDGLIPKCVRGYNDIVFDDTLYSLMREDWVRHMQGGFL